MVLLNGFIYYTIYTTVLCRGENPKSFCQNNKPFLLRNGTCADFNDVCVKIADPQCKNFRTACEQCSPNNNGVIIFEVLNLKSQTKVLSSKLDIFKGVCLTLCSVIVIMNITYFILLILEIKYKIITRHYKNNRKSNQDISSGNEQNENLLKQLKEQNEDLQKLSTEMTRKLYTEIDYSPLEIIQSYILKFQITGQNELLKLYVSADDNIIKLKRKICDKIIGIKADDYKIMKLKYKGVTLDDNQYLLSCIDSTQIPIYCEIDTNIDASKTVVLKIRGYRYATEYLQINKNQTIEELKKILYTLNKLPNQDLMIFKESKELIDGKTIKEYNLEDNDWIKVINKETGNLQLKSIFDEKSLIDIEYSTYDSISTLKRKVIKKIKCDPEDLILFSNENYLSENKHIYEYHISRKSQIKFCHIMKLDDIEICHQPFKESNPAFFKAQFKNSKKEMLVKKYKKSCLNEIHKELIKFLNTKSHPHFTQLLGVYKNNEFFYVAIKNMIVGTMESYLSSNECEISKWTKQILEGLKYLHNRTITMKDMNSTDILIDGNHNVKLPCFNCTYYLNKFTNNMYENEIKNGILKFVAPEILSKKNYGGQADVWSLGVILLNFVNGKLPFPKGAERGVIDKIIKYRTTEYVELLNGKDISDELKEFIKSCLIDDPNIRATVDQLMNHKFILKYQ